MLALNEILDHSGTKWTRTEECQGGNNIFKSRGFHIIHQAFHS